MTIKLIVTGLSAASLALASVQAFAAGRYGPGVSDNEIKVGNTMSYSGAASGLSSLGKAEAAYFAMVNEQGGVDGRKINFITRDDSYSPPKTVEVVRRLVEDEQVLVMFSMLGTAPNTAIQGYLNDNKVPHLFVASGADQWNDSKNHPWTMGWRPSYRIEARIYARYILSRLPDARIAVLYQNDDFGKELLAGLKEGLGDKAAMVVSEASYESTDPTVDSQVVTLQGSGADILCMFVYAKQGAQAIRKVYDIGWRPDKYIHLGAASVGATFVPAGVEKSVGVKTAGFIKDATDPKWADDAAVMAWRAWMGKHMPDADLKDSINVAGYSYAQTLEQVLRQCGSDLSRENIMRQATNLHDFRLPLLLPGSLINTSPTQYRVITYMKLQSFDGKGWEFV